MKILAIGSHPDDIEYGVGGTLLRYAKKKHDIYLLVMTAGEAAGETHIRKIEQQKAASLLNVKKLIWGNYKDTELVMNQNTVSFIEAAIDSIRPDEIYVNCPQDTHQDHRALADCVISASRYSKKVFFYEDFTSCDFSPDIFVDIENVLDEKINLISQHFSQINKPNPANLNLVDSIKAMANFRGFQGKIKYAEGFKAYRYLKEIA